MNPILDPSVSYPSLPHYFTPCVIFLRKTHLLFLLLLFLLLLLLLSHPPTPSPVVEGLARPLYIRQNVLNSRFFLPNSFLVDLLYVFCFVLFFYFVSVLPSWRLFSDLTHPHSWPIVLYYLPDAFLPSSPSAHCSPANLLLWSISCFLISISFSSFFSLSLSLF